MLLRCLPLVCSGSVAHGIARKEDVTSVGLLLCRHGLQLRSVPGLQQVGICTAVGIAGVGWDYTMVQHLKDKRAGSTPQRVSIEGRGAECIDFYQVVQHLSGKYRFEPETGDCA